MIYLQYVANGILLGGIYASIAAGLSLVWGVLNIVNLMHGILIVAGAYVAFFAYQMLGIHPFLSVIPAGILVGLCAYALQMVVINRVVAQSILVTLTLTFGLDLIVNNGMLLAFTADYRRVVLQNPLGVANVLGIIVPLDRAAATVLALVLTVALWLLLKTTRIGRAIIAVRFDRDAASLMGINVAQIYGITFAIGAALAAAAGSLISVVFPFSPLTEYSFLFKAFIICILGGVGSIPGAALGGFVLGLIESLGTAAFGPEHALTVSFGVLIAFLLLRPQGLLGRAGFE